MMRPRILMLCLLGLATPAPALAQGGGHPTCLYEHNAQLDAHLQGTACSRSQAQITQIVLDWEGPEVFTVNPPVIKVLASGVHPCFYQCDQELPCNTPACPVVYSRSVTKTERYTCSQTVSLEIAPGFVNRTIATISGAFTWQQTYEWTNSSTITVTQTWNVQPCSRLTVQMLEYTYTANGKKDLADELAIWEFTTGPCIGQHYETYCARHSGLSTASYNQLVFTELLERCPPGSPCRVCQW